MITNKKNILYIFSFLIICLSFTSCNKDKLMPYCFLDKTQYGHSCSWYENRNIAGLKDVDVFYIAPTCIWSWFDDKDRRNDFMDVNNINQKKSVALSIDIAKNIFGDSCNFYSPYYRQISMNCWFEDNASIEKNFKVAMEDITNAFDYYLKHINKNRPFILAGHSQGGKAVIELLKHHIDKKTYKRLIASYVIGYCITNDEVKNYPYLVPAKDSVDIGKVICFNSVANVNAISPLLKNNKVCINPISWKDDTMKVMGVMFHNNTNNDTFYVHLNKEKNVLIVDSLNKQSYYQPLLEKIFPLGNYHIEEPYLYFYALKKNILQRIHFYKFKNEFNSSKK
jgi:hypothetical protein